VKLKLLQNLLFVFTLVAGSAFAQRMPVSIINYANQPVATSSGKAIPVDQVKKAIQDAAARKGWVLSNDTGDKMLATLEVRSKHTVRVEIAYAADKYSITYSDSVNMNYHSEAHYDSRMPRPSSGATGPVIHPAYNTWVQELKEAIRGELMTKG
jgi:hypothetical protein